MDKLVYSLEDDPSIGELIKYTLSSQGYRCEVATTPEQLYALLEKEKPNIILLDIMLSGKETGVDVIKRLKANITTKEIPCIFLTSKATEIDKALGLDIGADDYLPKPFGVLELIARIKAVLRRYEKSSSTDTYKDLTINTESKQIFRGSEEIQLTFKEYELFINLLENAGAVISRDKLLDNVWGHDFFGERRTVDVHVRALRAKLGDDAENPKYIKTMRGYGYMLL